MPLTRFRLDVPELAPPWMRGPNLDTLTGAFGAELDAQAETIMRGRIESNPFAGGANPTREGAARLADGRLIECSPIVLPLLAEQADLRVYETEPILSRRFRISRSLQLHARRGTERGIMEHVQPYFLNCPAPPRIRIVHQSATGIATWHTLDSASVYSKQKIDPGNFDFDGQSAKWARWMCFLEMDGTGIEPPPLYGDGHVYGDGSVYGFNGLTAAAHADIVSMILDWQGETGVCVGIVLVWPPATLDPTATPTQDALGWWNLPNGANTWAKSYDPVTHLGTRPPGYQWIYDDSEAP